MFSLAQRGEVEHRKDQSPSDHLQCVLATVFATGSGLVQFESATERLKAAYSAMLKQELGNL